MGCSNLESEEAGNVVRYIIIVVEDDNDNDTDDDDSVDVGDEDDDEDDDDDDEPDELLGNVGDSNILEDDSGLKTLGIPLDRLEDGLKRALAIVLEDVWEIAIIPADCIEVTGLIDL